MPSTPQSSDALDNESKLALMRMAGYNVVQEHLTCWLYFPSGASMGLGTKNVQLAINDAFEIYLQDRTP